MFSSADSSFLLLTLGALLAFLTSQVFLGWIRVSQHQEGGWRWAALTVAALVFATGFAVALSIGLLGEALPFPIGYRTAWMLGLWLGAIALVLPLAAWPSFRPSTFTSLGVGTLLAAVVVGMQLTLLWSVGFRPGLRLRQEFVALAWLVMSVGFGAGVMLALPNRARRQRSEASRYAGAGLMGVAALAGESLLIGGTNLATQVGSVYRVQLSASLLSLVGGALLPVVLAIMIVDLELKRRAWRSERRRRHRPHAVAGARAGGQAPPASAAAPLSQPHG